MPSKTSLTLFLFVITAVTAAGKEFQVGDAVGWRIPATNETQLYNVWASRRRFHIGASLRFRYSTGSVVMVNKFGFYHCDSSHPILYFNDGNTLVYLDALGTFYFISGDSERCKKGQNMAVNVVNWRHFLPSIADAPRNHYYDVSPSPSQGLGSGAGLVSPLKIAYVGAALVFCLVYSY